MSIKLLALTVMLALYAAPIRGDSHVGEAGEAGEAGGAVSGGDVVVDKVVEKKNATAADECNDACEAARIACTLAKCAIQVGTCVADADCKLQLKVCRFNSSFSFAV